jgi:hypothetical protein
MGKYIILLYFLGGRNAYHSASQPASASQPCKSRNNVPQRGPSGFDAGRPGRLFVAAAAATALLLLLLLWK